jgi:hypothetical protein
MSSDVRMRRDIRRLSTEIVAFSPALGYVVEQLSQPDDRRMKDQWPWQKLPARTGLSPPA